MLRVIRFGPVPTPHRLGLLWASLTTESGIIPKGQDIEAQAKQE